MLAYLHAPPFNKVKVANGQRDLILAAKAQKQTSLKMSRSSLVTRWIFSLLMFVRRSLQPCRKQLKNVNSRKRDLPALSGRKITGVKSKGHHPQLGQPRDFRNQTVVTTTTFCVWSRGSRRHAWQQISPWSKKTKPFTLCKTIWSRFYWVLSQSMNSCRFCFSCCSCSQSLTLCQCFTWLYKTIFTWTTQRLSKDSNLFRSRHSTSFAAT